MGLGGGNDHRYSLIKSDLDDEDPDRVASTMPQMRTLEFGVRQRTLQNLVDLTARDKDAATSSIKMSWVNSSWFQWACGICIGINAVVVGMELEIKTAAWLYVEQTLLGFFCFELAARIVFHGRRFFVHEEDWAWNLFDIIIVVIGIFDQWVVPLCERFEFLLPTEGRRAGKMASFYMTMHICRLLRIMRILRLVRIVRPLHELSGGVIEAWAGMFWVLVIMVMTFYSVAILCTRMVGHGDILSEEWAEDPEIQEIQAMFSSVPDSMFTLFGTICSWSLTQYEPLFKNVPGLKPIFVLFYVYSAWALLAVMTGVVSENMIAIRDKMNKEDAHREEMRKTLITNLLIELFHSADADRSGTVSREEFDAMLKNPNLAKKMKKNSHLKLQDLQDLFEWLDHDGSGTITIDEFMMGFKWVNEPLRTKSLVKLQERLASDLHDMHSAVNEVMNSRTNELKSAVQAPLRKMHAITEQMQGLDVSFYGIKTMMREQMLAMPSPDELQSTTDRLESKIDQAIRQLGVLGLERPRQHSTESS